MEDKPVLLVIVGALGDWCIRRVIGHARHFAEVAAHSVSVILVDIHRTGAIGAWVARRSIERLAEELDHVAITVDDPSGVEVAVYVRMLRDPGHDLRATLTADLRLPDPTDPAYVGSGERAIEEFFTDFVRVPAPKELAKLGLNQAQQQSVLSEAAALVDRLKEEALGEFKDLKAYMEGMITRSGGERLPRYWQSLNKGKGGGIAYELEGHGAWGPQELEELCRSYRVIVYAATPPHAHAAVLDAWGPWADRIAFEKPIDGLLGPDGDLEEDGGRKGGRAKGRDWTLRLVPNDFADKVDSVIRSTAAARAALGLRPLSVVTVDHYNAKWALHAIEFVLGWHVAEHILTQPSRIVIRAYEEAILPRGRFEFYNGVGGALADMLSHLVQPLRALLRQAHVSSVLDSLHLKRLDRARYRVAETLREPRPSPFKARYSCGAAALRLFSDTETAGRILCEFTSGPWTGVEVEISTGKGCWPASKLVAIERDGQAVVFDFGGKRIVLGKLGPDGDIDPDEIEWTGVPTVRGPGGRRIMPDAEDYVEIFHELCAWEPPDPRFYPAVREASELYEWYREILVLARFLGPLTSDHDYDAYTRPDESCAAWH